MTAFTGPWPLDDEAPLCRTAGCAELGIRAVDRHGWCTDCTAAMEEDEARRQADLRREDRRDGP